MKSILIILFFLCSFVGFSQNLNLNNNKVSILTNGLFQVGNSTNSVQLDDTTGLLLKGTGTVVEYSTIN